MAISMGYIAFGAVIVAGVTLFSIGTPHNRARLLASAVAAQAPVAPAATAVLTIAASGITLHSVSVELSDGDREFPGGPSAETINNDCLACHSAGMVLTQPKLPRAVWQAEVDKMRNLFRAPVPLEDEPAIVEYLANLDPCS